MTARAAKPKRREGTHTYGKPFVRAVSGLPAEVRTPEGEWHEAAFGGLDMGGDSPAIEYALARTVLTRPPYNGLVVSGFRHLSGLV